MTALLPQRGPSTPGGPVPLRRVRSVYGVRIFDPTDGSTRIDYVGKTIRDIQVRLAEHRGFGRNPDDEQPWSDLVVDVVCLESDATLAVAWSDADLAGRERMWIRNAEGGLPHAPRYNWADGGDLNPLHIPKWEAVEARRQRDLARGLTTRWTTPELFPTVRAVQPAPVATPPSTWSRLAATRFGRWAVRKLQQAGGVAGAWVAVWLVAVLGLHQPPRQAASTAWSILAAAAVAVVVWRARRNTNRRRRSRRTPRRRSR